MRVGTNFWFLASFSGMTPFVTGINWKTAYAGGADIWDPTFVSEVKVYDTFRFMDWNVTNEQEDVNWKDRTLPTADQAAAGEDGRAMAYEWMADLTNRTGTNMWINVPLKASDDYITQMATTLYTALAAPAKLYVEYSNEVWNFETQQQWCQSHGNAIFGGTEWTNIERYYAYRSIQIWQIFRSVWGDADYAARVLPVLGGQAGNTGVVEGQQEVLQNATYNPQNLWPAYYATAPYFAGSSYAAMKTDTDGQAEALAADVAAWTGGTVGQHKVGLVCYEGGADAASLSDAQALSLTTGAGMYDTYTYFLNTIAPYCKMFAHYAHTSPCDSANTCWGANQYTGQPIADAPKYRALVDWIAAH